MTLNQMQAADNNVSKFYHVNVIGLGFVGLPTAALLANAGHTVRGIDIDRILLETLNKGASPIQEEEVAKQVERALSGARFVVSSIVSKADVHIICVPTPLADDKTADLSMVQAAIESMVHEVKKGDLILLESTSPIGTTDTLLAGILRDHGFDPEKDLDICYCPERVFPGSTISEIVENNRVVGGLTPQASTRARQFYASFCQGEITETSARAAEFSKLMENTFRDVNIALANSFAKIAEQAEIDVHNVIELANRHPRVNVHTPGPGVGGHCIPVDPWFLIAGYPEQAALLKHAREINMGQASHLIDRAIDSGLSPKSKIALLGSAYRGDIEDTRESPTWIFVKTLQDRGFSVSLYDPLASTSDPHINKDIDVRNSVESAVESADAVFILTDHSIFKFLRPQDFAKMKGRLILDTRRIIRSENFVNNGFNVVEVGAPNLSK